MNKATNNFLQELKSRGDVLGVILFGSWARGNSRPDSDVDLVVILSDGYQRTVEQRGTQIFEIIYTTEKDALEYWASHPDDAAGLWQVAKVLYDRDGTIERLRANATEILKRGKKPINARQREQFHFDAEDQVEYTQRILALDPATASLILTNKVFSLTELFFDLRRRWTPAPKQRLAEIAAISRQFSELLQKFYAEDASMKEKFAVAKQIIAVVFGEPEDGHLRSGTGTETTAPERL